MKGLLVLAWRHALHHRGRTAILALCLGLAGALPITTTTLMARYRADLTARAASTPLLAGPEGNRFDLTLGALYFRTSELAPVPASLARELVDEDAGLVVPLHTRCTARGRPVVGTTPEYFERRGLRAAEGDLPLVVGEAVLGATAAAALELGAGATLFTDPFQAYDIATPASLELAVVGVLARTGSPDDDAVFVDLKTTWAIEGLGHGHGDVTAEGALPEGFVLSRTDDQVAVSPALIEERRLAIEDAADFHLHGDPDTFPLSAVMVFPRDAKAGTLLKSKVDLRPDVQVVVPAQVVEDLLAFVFRIKSFLDRLSGVLLASTALFAGLVLLLSARLRADEFRTLHAIGCGRRAVAQLVGCEIGGLLLLSAILSIAIASATVFLMPDLVRTL